MRTVGKVKGVVRVRRVARAREATGRGHLATTPRMLSCSPSEPLTESPVGQARGRRSARRANSPNEAKLIRTKLSVPAKNHRRRPRARRRRSHLAPVGKANVTGVESTCPNWARRSSRRLARCRGSTEWVTSSTKCKSRSRKSLGRWKENSQETNTHVKSLSKLSRRD